MGGLAHARRGLPALTYRAASCRRRVRQCEGPTTFKAEDSYSTPSFLFLYSPSPVVSLPRFFLVVVVLCTRSTPGILDCSYSSDYCPGPLGHSDHCWAEWAGSPTGSPKHRQGWCHGVGFHSCTPLTQHICQTSILVVSGIGLGWVTIVFHIESRTINTPLTVRACSYYPPTQANTKAAHIDC